MSKKIIEAIFCPDHFDPVVRALSSFNIENYRICNVKEIGLFCTPPNQMRKLIPFQPLSKTKLEIVLDENLVDSVAKTILSSTYTGKLGDGKIFIAGRV